MLGHGGPDAAGTWTCRSGHMQRAAGFGDETVQWTVSLKAALPKEYLSAADAVKKASEPALEL